MLHRLATVTLGVPDPGAVGSFYTDFGLTETTPGRYASTDGGEQLRLVRAPGRHLSEMTIGCDDPDDLARVARAMVDLCVPVTTGDGRVTATDPGTGVSVNVAVTRRCDPPRRVPETRDRNTRAPAVTRAVAVEPRKLSHVVLGSRDLEASMRFFVDAIGCEVSDSIAGGASFLRCSQDHHNVLVQPAPVAFCHHLAWQVDDVDEVGRGAHAMLAADPGRHVWGLGRHHIGSNFFWYLRDPSGTFAEYTSDVDQITDRDVWRPEVFADIRALYSWGPAVPPSFLAPDDLAELMAVGAGRPGRAPAVSPPAAG